ncbi:glycosyltransferase family A protein [Pedobacter cryoconitis]|uniref:Glycosyltransferase 2-like domain-containing protein n=1 Tax=Pedobacter cryoconitis TaxID=188932 RepID=A0A7X0ML97_9SPHI|nr:glycosyltransferase family A protein [Pedobacter cryoconitis]MBB6503029.1 hypothetical protein [Pedobacter cryoconitis]
MNDITVCITSCGRIDLLERTLDSFFEFNTYPIKEILIIDDFGFENTDLKKRMRPLEKKFNKHPIKWFYNKKRKGQIVSIDKLYSLVSTPLIFHCEDDWEFYKKGFIEQSILELENNPKCIQVWLREFYDTNGHPIYFAGKKWRLMENYLDLWNGFSFNPGVKRLSDYKLLGKYSDHVSFDDKIPWGSECLIGILYQKLGYFACIFSEGYVKHIGQGRHVNGQLE